MKVSLTARQAQLVFDALVDYHSDVVEAPEDYVPRTADRLATLITKLDRQIDPGPDWWPQGER